MRVFHEFEPFYNKDSKILILGSIPSQESRRKGFYYLHNQNRFWPVLAKVFGETLPLTIEEKKNFLLKHNIALWDVLASCDIISSSDSTIKSPVVNDIKSIIKLTKIEKIFITGKTAYNLYNKYIFPKLKIEGIYLPSPSSANCKLKFDDLVKEYQKVKDDK